MTTFLTAIAPPGATVTVAPIVTTKLLIVEFVPPVPTIVHGPVPSTSSSPTSVVVRPENETVPDCGSVWGKGAPPPGGVGCGPPRMPSSPKPGGVAVSTHCDCVTSQYAHCGLPVELVPA